MISLLPSRARAKAAHEYWRRLAAVNLGLVAVLCLTVLAMLVPSYFAVRARQIAAEQAEELATQTITDPALTDATVQIKQATVLYSAVQQKASAPRSSTVIELMVSARPHGVVIQNISYSSTLNTVNIVLGGVANTREELLAYKSALGVLPGVASADFPPADLAASSTVGFVFTIKYLPPSTGTTTSSH